MQRPLAPLGESGRYGDPQAEELRAAIARRRGVALEEVIVGAGVDDLLGLAVRAYLADGGIAVASLGGFPTFEMHVIGFGGRLTRVPYLPEARVDLDGLLAAAHAHGGALVYVANPDNPTGSHYPWTRIAEFLDALPEGSLLIHDEAYSKEYGLAGLRVGYERLGRELGIPTFPSTTNFVLFDFGSRERAERVVRELIERGVHVRKPPSPPLDGCVRISVGSPSERKLLETSLRDVARLL